MNVYAWQSPWPFRASIRVFRGSGFYIHQHTFQSQIHDFSGNLSHLKSGWPQKVVKVTGRPTPAHISTSHSSNFTAADFIRRKQLRQSWPLLDLTTQIKLLSKVRAEPSLFSAESQSPCTPQDPAQGGLEGTTEVCSSGVHVLEHMCALWVWGHGDIIWPSIFSDSLSSYGHVILSWEALGLRLCVSLLQGTNTTDAIHWFTWTACLWSVRGNVPKHREHMLQTAGWAWNETSNAGGGRTKLSNEPECHHRNHDLLTDNGSHLFPQRWNTKEE